MKKVLIGLLMVIPLLIVGAVLLITEVILLTPDIAVTGIEIVDEYQVAVKEVEVENYTFGKKCEPQLYAKVSPSKANNKKVKWTIENVTKFNADFDGDIAVVEDGIVTVFSSGSFDVVVTTDDGGLKASCFFLVKSDFATSGYIVYNGQKTDDLGESVATTTDKAIKLEACARPTDVDIETLKWEVVSGADVLSVDANGIVVPKKAGSAVVKMSIKSYDKKNASGAVTKAAPVITDEVTINVSDGAFKVPYLYTTANTVALAELGAEGATATILDGCTLTGDTLTFTASRGTAIFAKNGTSITVRKFAADDIYFENFDVLKEHAAKRAIITGKIPYFLNCISAATGERVDADFNYSDASIATVDAKDGRIITKKDKDGKDAEGEVTFTALFGAGVSSISFNIKSPVIYFKLAPDTYDGIARERIYGTKWYTDTMDITYNRTKLHILQPANIDNTRFTWVCDNTDVCSIDENGAITMTDLDGERVINVTITAKESPYTIDSIKSTYTFTVKNGINVKNVREITAAADARTDDIFLQGDIKYRDDNQSWHLRVYKSMYGNGHMIDWRDAANDAIRNLQGADILEMHGDNTVLRNVKIRSAIEPPDGNFSSKNFSHKCLETYGNNLLVQYCEFEYAQFCVQVSSTNSTFDGCIFKNSSKFSLFSWCTRENQKTVVNNCIFGISAAPSIGFSSGDDDDKHTCNLEFTGFLHVYNWKQSVDMDMIGEIKENDDALNGLIKKLVNDELAKPKYNEYFLMQNGVKYMHCGMLFSGLEHKCKVTVTGALERGFEIMEVDLNELLFGKKPAEGEEGFNNVYAYTYAKEGPVMPWDKFEGASEENCRILREGIPETNN